MNEGNRTIKFVGILNDHEQGLVKIGRPLTDYRIDEGIQHDDFERVLSYLNTGRVVIAFLHYVSDKQNNPIVPLIFYTDGAWIWPSYLAYYYSNKYYSMIPHEFIADMKNNNFIVPRVTEEQFADVQKVYVTTYDPNRNR